MYIISRCISKDDNYYHFHFKGYLKGSYISKILVEFTQELVVGEDYIIKAKAARREGQVLYIKVAKMRLLFN